MFHPLVLIIVAGLACVRSQEFIVPSAEVTGLEYLYSSTGGDNWFWNASAEAGPHWSFPPTTSPCAQNPGVWQGLNCSCLFNGTAELCNIIGIELAGYSLLGSVPHELALVSNLELLDLSNNFLKGTDLNFVCALSKLNDFVIRSSLLTSTIPSCISLASSLSYLHLGLNELSGSLPYQLGGLSALSALTVESNHRLSGTLPATLCELHRAVRLDFSGNMFLGTIPACLGQISGLVSLTLSYNRLTGTLSPSLFAAPNSLQLVYLSYNDLHGTLPVTLWDLHELQMVDLVDNAFSGTLPPLIPRSLATLWLSENQFTGSIPSTWTSTNTTALAQLKLNGNSLTSTIPESVGELAGLVYLDVSENMLDGSLPSSLILATALSYLYINDNALTGTGQDVFTNLPSSVFSLDLSFNGFAGTFPFGVSGGSLVDVYCRGNRFTGSIPAANLVMLETIVKLDLSQNYFSGTVPLALTSSPKLNLLLLGNNRLGGQLYDAFPDSVTAKFITVDVGSNLISGSLPSSLCGAPLMQNLIAGQNCFTGGIPTAICQAASLKTLDLAGLTTGCAFIYDKFSYAKRVLGDIPSCLFSSSSLKTLSLSGNGMRTHLGDLSPVSNLTNVSLSYNRIRGPIPDSMKQYNDFNLFDLSVNRISGTLEGVSWFENQTGRETNRALDLKLIANRLSGKIPSSFNSAPALDILSGNMFQCLHQSDLPPNDRGVNNYFCGSELLNGSIYAFAAIACVRAAVIALVFYFFSDCCHCASVVYGAFNQLIEIVLWQQQADSSVCSSSVPSPLKVLAAKKNCHRPALETAMALGGMSARHRNFLFGILVTILVVFVPIYLILKLTGNNSSQTFQYGWFVSMGFMESNDTATTMFAFLVVMLPLFLVFDHWMSLCFRRKIKYSAFLSVAPESSAVRRSNKLLLSVLGIVNAVVVFLMNGGYVYTVFYQPAEIQTTVLVLTSILKAMWSDGFMNWALRVLNGRKGILLLVTIFNNVLVPIVCTAAVDIDCFYHVFVPAEPITTLISISNYKCEFDINTLSSGVCVDTPLLLQTTFNAPFIYSGQCANSLLTNYVPVYIVMYGILNAIHMVLQLFTLQLFYGKQPDRDGDFWSRWLYEIKIGSSNRSGGNSSADNVEHMGYDIGTKESDELRRRKENLDFYRLISVAIIDFRVLPLTWGEDLRAYNSPNCSTMYNLRDMCVNLIVAMLLLVSYGLAYPLLGVVIVLDCVLMTALRQLCVHSHLLQLHSYSESVTDEAGGVRARMLEQWRHGLTHELDHMKAMLFAPKTGLVVLVPLFLFIFLLDMSKDDTVLGAAVYGIVLIAWGVLCAALYQYHVRRSKKSHRRTVVSRRISLAAAKTFMWPVKSPDEDTEGVAADSSHIDGTQLVDAAIFNPVYQKSFDNDLPAVV